MLDRRPTLDRPTLDRRQAIAGALAFGGLWTMLAASGGAIAQEAPLAWSPKALSPAQARVLEPLVDLIMPATDTPGARQVGVPQFIDRAVGDFLPAADAALIRTGLDRIDADARAQGASFAGLGAARQTALLNRYEAEIAASPAGTPTFFALLKDLTTVGYFTSEPGATQALRYDQTPGFYRGCVPLSEVGRGWATT